MSANAQLDYLWVLVCAALVFIMQAGFLCLESGLTRRKNSINVAIKNLADFCVTTVVFWLVGYGIMFGTSYAGWFGTDRMALDFGNSTPEARAFFLFQVMFCGAAVTIMSGAVAERVRLGSYLFVAFVVSGVVYPLFGHWAWAGLDSGSSNGLLNASGFVDFAGSSVVHSVGGWVALAMLLVIGPRRGRFLHDGTSVRIIPSNLPLATFGVILLFIGWIGFNGGSTLALNAQVSLILINTVIAGCVGALSAGLLGYAVYSRLEVTQFMNGCLAGLVAVTANCFAISTAVAALIGLVGAMIAVFAERLLENFRIDDAVGAVPVHLAAGIWGTLAVGLYGDLSMLGTGLSRIEQIAVQAQGVVACFVCAFVAPFFLLKAVNRRYPLRVSAEDEDVGLNIAEHGERGEEEAAAGQIPS